MNYDYLFKIILLGDTCYGKSSIVRRLLKDEYKDIPEPTIGLDFAVSRIELQNNKKIKFHIWDTAGQEAYSSIIKTYYKNIACAFIVMDVGNENSFEQAEKWLKRYEDEKSNGSKAPAIIISNKLDIKNRKYTEEEGKKFAEQYGCIYCEVSAKTGANCKRILHIMAEHIYKYMNKNIFFEEPGIKKEGLVPRLKVKSESIRTCCTTQ